MWSDLRRTLRPARRAFDAAAQGAWTAGFGVVGRLDPRDLSRIEPCGGARVLAIVAHPDDEVGGPGGTLIRHVVAGDRVAVAVVTDGRASRAHGLAPEEMARTRRAEAEAAAAILGVGRLLWCGFPEGAWSLPQAAQRLAEVIVEEAPSVVYVHAPFDYHPEHVATARATAEALERAAAAVTPAGAGMRVRVFGVDVPLGAALATHVTDVGDGMARFRAAAAAHASQQYATGRLERLRVYTARRFGIASGAEVFTELETAAYVSLVRRAARVGGVRGIRPRPATDPLAWCVGGSARRAMGLR